MQKPADSRQKPADSQVRFDPQNDAFTRPFPMLFAASTKAWALYQNIMNLAFLEISPEDPHETN